MNFDRTPSWLAWLILGLLLAPLWLSGWLPATDFTNHLARTWILSKLPGDAFWAQHYYANSLIASNMAIDLLAPLLFRVFSPELTGRVFMSLIVVMHWGGVQFLAKQGGTGGWLTLIPLFLVYNSIYYMGFVNYCLSITLVVWIVAIWVGPRMASSSWLTAIGLLALGTAAYFCHLGGTFCMLVSAGFLGLWDLWRRQLDLRKLIYYGLPFIIPAILYICWPPMKPIQVPTIWDSISTKLLKSMSFFTGYDFRMDMIVVALFVAGAVLAWRAGLEWEPRILGLGLVFWLFFATFPYTMASGSDAYARIIIPAGTFLATSVRLRPGRGWQGAFGLLFASMVFKMILLSGNWLAIGREARAQLDLLDSVEKHSVVLPLIYTPATIGDQKWERFTHHLATAVVYRRDAMVPTTFAVSGMHSVSLRQPLGLRPGVDDTLGWGRVPPEYLGDATLIDLRHVFTTTDYIYAWRLPEAAKARILNYANLVETVGEGLLFRRK